MKILIEVRGGIVETVWCEQPEGAEVIVRDFDNIETGGADPIEDPGVAELRTPHFVIY
jgi:hypothetical protein